MLLDVGRETFPVGQVDGIFALRPHRSHSKVRSRQSFSVILDSFGQSQLIERYMFIENLANRTVDLMVHFQDVFFAYITFLARLYHIQHAVQPRFVHEIFLIILHGCLVIVL